MSERGAATMKRIDPPSKEDREQTSPAKDNLERASEAKANFENAMASMARLRATIDNRPARLASEQRKTAR